MIRCHGRVRFFSYDFAMTTPGITIQLGQVFDQSGSEWIEMNVADQFKQVSILFADDGFVTVLEYMAATVMAVVETDGVAGQQASHQAGEFDSLRDQQQVKVIGDQRPGIAQGVCLGKQKIQAFDEIFPILISEKNITAINPSGDNVV